MLTGTSAYAYPTFGRANGPMSASACKKKSARPMPFSRIACILIIPMSTCESLETDREATRASPIAAAVGSMAPRSGEGHDQWYRFAFSLTNRASVTIRNSRGRVSYRPVPDGHLHISTCREAAVDEASRAWRSEAAGVRIRSMHHLVTPSVDRRSRTTPDRRMPTATRRAR